MFRKKKKDPRDSLKGWEGILLIGILVVAGVLAIVQAFGEPRNGGVEEEDSVLNQFTCLASGGAWENCGSACRGEDVETCIEVCTEYCVCQSNAECPFGYSCGDYIGTLGVCKENGL